MPSSVRDVPDGPKCDGGLLVLPKVIKGYEDHGFHVDLGNPSRLYATLREQSTGAEQGCGGGISVTDLALFTGLARVLSPSAIFVIGNAFGYSTFTLAELFPFAIVDAIDAECEGAENARGSELTRRIAASNYPNVSLTIGYSPQDLRRAMRSPSYQLAFVDGLHTPEQMVADYLGLEPFLDEASVVVFHDVALCRMTSAWAEILTLAEPHGFSGYEMAFTQFGLCVLIRGLVDAERYVESISAGFENHNYHLGVPPPEAPPPRRSRFKSLWTKSPQEVVEFLKRRVNAAGRR